MKARLARLRALIAHAGQCAQCGAWFENWDGGICSACQSNGH